MKSMGELINGLVLCVCESEDILIINVYTMTIVNRFSEDFTDIEKCHIDIVDGSLSITLLDKKQKVHVIRTSRINL